MHLGGNHQVLSAQCLAHLAGLSRLTHLELSACVLAAGASVEQLVRLLSLPRLQQCDLTGTSLVHAEASLAAAAPQLAAATQLTSLLFDGCGLSESSIDVIVRNLSSLRCLRLCRSNVTDAVMSSIAADAQQLTSGVDV